MNVRLLDKVKYSLFYQKMWLKAISPIVEPYNDPSLNPHKTISMINKDGNKFKIDEKIALLIHILWKNGIETFNSCQGDYDLVNLYVEKENNSFYVSRGLTYIVFDCDKNIAIDMLDIAGLVSKDDYFPYPFLNRIYACDEESFCWSLSFHPAIIDVFVDELDKYFLSK